jgi:hypothetical protein
MFIDTFIEYAPSNAASGEGRASASPTRLQAQLPRQVRGHRAEFGRQVDAGDAAAEALRQVARRPADAAAHVEQVVGGGGPHHGRQVLGGFQAAAVELVVRCQRLGRGPGRVDAVFGQRGLQAL